MTDSPLFRELEERLTELRAEHARFLADLPVAQQEVRQALHAYEIAQARMSRLVVAVNRACGQGECLPGGTITPQFEAMLAHERAQYNATGLALTKARNRLADVKWRLECAIDDIVKLDRMIRPPAPPTVAVIRTRDRKPVEGTEGDADSVDDTIIYPSGRAA